jgi:hypothetical protein
MNQSPNSSKDITTNNEPELNETVYFPYQVGIFVLLVNKTLTAPDTVLTIGS